MVNGCFEGGGGLMLLLNVRRLRRDRRVQGVSIPVQAFWTGWGVWNLWFYPHLGQWVSFFGGISVVLGNAAWVALALWYERWAILRRLVFTAAWVCFKIEEVRRWTKSRLS